MAASLLIRYFDGTCLEVTLDETNTLGRSPEQDIQILDACVSRAHAAIAYADHHYWFQDRSSKNGAYLNGAPILGPIRLVDGDVIQLGDTMLTFSDRCRVGIRFYRGEADYESDEPSALADRLSHLEFPSSSHGSCSGSVDE